MSDRFDYWIHGVNVQVEFPDRIQSIRRAGWGTDVEQEEGTDNWFHFAIPTPTYLDDDLVDMLRVRFRGYINHNATIDLVATREGGNAQSLTKWPVSLSAQQLDEGFNLPGGQSTQPLVLCIHVKFDGPDGKITFAGAGAAFDERT